jgi:TolB protein
VKLMSRLPALLLLLPVLAHAQKTVIEISGANFRPMPIAAPPPLVADDGTRRVQGEFDAALMFDLSACGLFQVLDRKGYLAPTLEGATVAAISFSRWSDVGAESLVKTQLALEGETVRGELHFFNVGAGREDYKVAEAVPARDVRRLAHKLVGGLYRFLTHETGPFESRIAYSLRTPPDNRDVWVADWDGHRAVKVTQGNVNVIPALIPGDGVAFTSYRQRRPWLYSVKGTGEPTLLIGRGAMVTGAAFSADGRRVAVSISEGENAEIYAAAADGSGLARLTDTRFFLNTSPTWSPDGKRLAFVSNRGGNPQIYVMNADGTQVKRLTFQGTYNTTPSWSPRGDLIAFTARDERNAFDLFTVNVETGKVLRLTQDASNNEEPVFSPNGRLILFTSTRGGTRHLHVMTADGNNQLPLPIERGDYATPDWGP